MLLRRFFFAYLAVRKWRTCIGASAVLLWMTAVGSAGINPQPWKPSNSMFMYEGFKSPIQHLMRSHYQLLQVGRLLQEHRKQLQRKIKRAIHANKRRKQ